MRTLASLAFGAVALTAASIALAQPAAARSDFGIYVGPAGFGVNVDDYRDYCRDGWYRRRHWNYCQRFYSGHHDGDYGWHDDDWDDDYRYRRHDWYDYGDDDDDDDD